MKKQNNHLGVAVTSAATANNNRPDSIPPSTRPEANDICPDCRVRLIRLGACFSCPTCGYGSCG